MSDEHNTPSDLTAPIKVDPYLDWQQKNDAQLMDGSESPKTYIRIGTAGTLEVGVRPRVGRPSAGILGLHLTLRSAHKGAQVLVEDPDVEGSNIIAFPGSMPGAKSAKLKALTNTLPRVQWSKIDETRASVGVQFLIPTTIAEVAEFRLMIDSGLSSALLRLLTKSNDLSELDEGARALDNWLRMAANQSFSFAEPMDTVPVVAELPERMAKWLNGLKEAAETAATGA